MEQSPGSWTPDIKDFLDERDLRYQQRFEAQEKAIDKAFDELLERLKNTNEWRTLTEDRARDFMPRVEAEQRIGVNTERVSHLSSRIDKIEGRVVGSTSSLNLVFAVIGAIGVLFGIASLVFSVVR